MSSDLKFIPDNEINNSVYKAIYSGNVDKVNELIDSYGLAYDSSWDNGFDLVLTAIKCNHIDVAKLLINKGCKLESTSQNAPESAKSILPLLVKQGVVELIKLILAIDKGLLNKTEAGDSLLHIAVSEGHQDVVEFLLQQGVDVESKNKSGLTALHVAADRGLLNIIELIIGYGANVDSEVEYGKTSLYLSVSNGHQDTVKYLLKQGANTNVMYKNKNSQTPLIEAITKGYLIIVKYLLDFGANVNEKNAFGHTPLHVACLLKNEKIICTLLNAGADVNAMDSNGMVPSDVIFRIKTHDYLIMENPSLLYILGRHLITLKIGGFYLNHKNTKFYNMFYNVYLSEITVGGMVLSPRSSVLNSLEEECKNEISLMKSFKGDRGITLFDILEKLKKPLSVITESEIQLFESVDIDQQLPIYVFILKNLFKAAKVRYKLVKSAQEWLLFIVRFSSNSLPVLPEEMIFLIVSCLGNCDLEQLIKCGEEVKEELGFT